MFAILLLWGIFLFRTLIIIALIIGLYLVFTKHLQTGNTVKKEKNRGKPPHLKTALKPLISLPKPTENINTKLKELSAGEIEWPEFSRFYQKMNPQFVANLQRLDINHTPNTLKHSICLRLNLSLKETASVLDVSVSSVKNARNRLKKQLNLPPNQQVGDYINSL